MADLRYFLAIYVHAHQTGNSVPPHIDAEARAALAEQPVMPTDEELREMFNENNWNYISPETFEDIARAVLTRWGNPAPQPPAEGEAAELVAALRQEADACFQLKSCGYVEWASRLTRAADLLRRLSPPQPLPVSEPLPVGVEQALIKAECALSDIAEGEPEENEGDADALLQWAEQRAATALSRIRPVMRLHGILTSEWPPLPAHALPIPQQQENING